jgi:hypothetical protein
VFIKVFFVRLSVGLPLYTLRCFALFDIYNITYIYIKKSINKRRNFLEIEKERPFHNEIRSRLNSVNGSICAQHCTNNAREKCVKRAEKNMHISLSLRRNQ